MEQETFTIDMEIEEQAISMPENCTEWNVGLTDTYDVEDSISSAPDDIERVQEEEESRIWIDPARGPFVFNYCGIYYSVSQAICYFSMPMHDSPAEETTNEFSGDIQTADMDPQNTTTELYISNEYDQSLESIFGFCIEMDQEIVLERVNDPEGLKSLELPSTSAQRPNCPESREADEIIAKVLASKCFFIRPEKKGKLKKYNKTCEICTKSFRRLAEFKRHLIEHLIRSTLVKSPVDENGELRIKCEVCKVEIFNKVDSYKIHLRKHAKLALIQCNLCDKSFSDSSNITKHRKIHGITMCFQCDLCQRKFTSKERIIQHMEYHNNNSPIPCSYCNETFHFKSTLNKHMKFVHKKKTIWFRCRFCCENLKGPKEKLEHEWKIHKARKQIFDCSTCGSKFRLYSELKRHCKNTHQLVIPPSTTFPRNESFR